MLFRSFTYAIRLGNGTLGWATVQVEIAPPKLGVALLHDTGVSSTDNITRDGTLSLAGVAQGATVQYSTDGGLHWSNTFQATEGANNVLVHQVDVKGNVSDRASLSFTLDTTPPTVPVISTTVPAQTNAASVDVAGTAEANSIVTLYNGSSVVGTTTADGAGHWGITHVSLKDRKSVV